MKVGQEVYVAIKDEMKKGKIYAALEGKSNQSAIKLEDDTLMFANQNQLLDLEEWVKNLNEIAPQAVEKAEKERDLRAGGTVSIQDKYIKPTKNRINNLINDIQANLGSCYSVAMNLQDDGSNPTEFQYLDNIKESLIQCVKDVERYRQSE